MLPTIVAIVTGALVLGTAAFAGDWLAVAALAALGVLAVWLVGAAVRVAAHGELPAFASVRAARQPQQAGDRRQVDADRLAVVALLCAATGLFVFNLVLGPLAAALGIVALQRGALLRPTALLASALGVVDVVVVTTVIGHALHHGGLLLQFGT